MLTYAACLRRKIPKYIAFIICRYAGLEYTVGPEIVAGEKDCWEKACISDNPNLICFYENIRAPIRHMALNILTRMEYDVDEAFLISCEINHFYMMCFFMKRGANCWDLALERVVVYGHYGLIKFLLQKGAKPTALTVIYCENSPILQKLIKIPPKKLNYIK